MRTPLVSAASLIVVLVLAGSAAAAGNPSAGKAVYNANGCGGCHTFKAAGSKGKVGPALAKSSLSARAKSAKQPLVVYVRTSVVNPNKVVVKGYSKGVMPAYAKLTKKQLDDLVAFVAKG
jgi:mono/diheme cytochrome c family protein